MYEYKINIEGNLSKKEKDELHSKLENQLDDSIHVRYASQLYRQVLKKPPAFDRDAAERSINYMNALLNAQGYFRDTVNYTDTVIVKADQLRTSVIFNVKPGKLVLLDSISYTLENPDLQRLTDSSKSGSLLKKGEAFSKTTVSNELDRLVEIFRNNGYLRFTKEELKGYWDTLDISLLQPGIDPFEQLEILQKINKRRENPTANLDIRLRKGFDKAKLTKYYVGNMHVYPDFNKDTLDFSPKDVNISNAKVTYYRNMFKPKIFPPNIYLKKGDLYKQSNYFRTINRFNAMGAWGLVNIETLLRKDQDTVDFRLKLSPAKKYGFSFNLEGSINQSPISGKLFGVAANFGLQNRNFARAANTANTNVRYGIEFGSDPAKSFFVQTRQFNVSHNIFFPKLILPKNWFKKVRENARTVLSFNASSTERRLLYHLTTLNASWGYEFQWKNQLLSIRVPTIEYSLLNRRDSLKNLILKNPSLNYIFTDGFIASLLSANYSIFWGKGNKLNVFRVNGEESGLSVGWIPSKFLDSNLYQFLKFDVDFTHKIQIRKTSFIFHGFAGIGYEFNSTVDSVKRNSLPFFKQYFSGGPNSMRAWRLKQLGPGSDTSGTPDRYDDVQLEANFEYRFPITKIASSKLNGAIFCDIGNVWFLKSAAAPDHPEKVFPKNLSQLGNDIAVGLGAGLRIDLGFFVVRLDYSYKAKNPSRANAAYQNKWFYDWKPLGGLLQVGINYPFISDLFTK